MRHAPPLTALGAALALCLTACGPQTSDDRPKAPAVVGPVLVTFGENGAGEITGKTPFDRAQIAGLFPKAQVEAAATGPGGANVISVRRSDGLALDLHAGLSPERIGRVFGLGGPVVGPQGETLGQPWAETGFDPATCVRGAEEMGDKLICYRPGEARLGYVFDLPGYDGPEAMIPEPAFLETAARLSAFVWTAPAS